MRTRSSLSLRRVVLNRDSGMERPHDWISNDPDFAPLLRETPPIRRSGPS